MWDGLQTLSWMSADGNKNVSRWTWAYFRNNEGSGLTPAETIFGNVEGDGTWKGRLLWKIFPSLPLIENFWSAKHLHTFAHLLFPNKNMKLVWLCSFCRSINWISEKLGSSPQVIHLVRTQLRNKLEKCLKFIATIQERDHQGGLINTTEMQIWKVYLRDLAEVEWVGLGDLLNEGIEKRSKRR